MLTLCRLSKSRGFTLHVDPALRFPNTTHAHAGESLLRVTQERAELTTPGPESGAYYGSIIQRSDGDNQRQNLENRDLQLDLVFPSSQHVLYRRARSMR